MGDVSKDKAVELAHFRTDVHGSDDVSAAALPRSDGGGVEWQRWIGRTYIFKLVLAVALIGCAAVLFQLSLRLAGIRMYHPAECANIFIARLVATGQAVDRVDLFQVLLSRVLPKATRSIDLFAAGRAGMVLVFWLNWLLLAIATGERVPSLRWLMALVAAATLAPLWSHGFEVRRENLVLAGLLLIWMLVRFSPARSRTYFGMGVIVSALQFLAPDSVIYTAPLSLALVILPLSEAPVHRGKLALSWVLGVIATVGVVRMLYGAMGVWESGTAGMRSELAELGTAFHVVPATAMAGLFNGAPLLVALLAAATLARVADVFRRKSDAGAVNGDAPEAAVFLGFFLIWFGRSAGHPQEALYWIPFGFLFVFRYAVLRFDEIPNRGIFVPATVGLVIFAHVIPFAEAGRTYFRRVNFDQESVMALAEDLTDPANDAVFDAVGLVPTRSAARAQPLVGLTGLPGACRMPESEARTMLVAVPPAVIVFNRRVDALTHSNNWAFIRDNYVPLADEFWVLGHILPSGGGRLGIVHGGRYRLAALEGSDIAGTFPTGFAGLGAPELKGTLTGRLDQKPVSDGVVELAEGEHTLETGPECRPTLVWVGPRISRVHRLHQTDHRELFATEE